MIGPARLVALSLLIVASVSGIVAQNPGFTDSLDQLRGKVPAEFIQMLQVQATWDTGFGHPDRRQLRFTKVDEFDRSGSHFTRFRIYADGVQEGHPFILALLKIGTYAKDVQILSNAVYVNQKGLILTKAPSKDAESQETVSDGTEFDVGIQAANGEPLRFLLRSKDDKVMIPGTLVPFPIESSDHGCSLTARLAVPEGQAILIEGDGFAPNSEVAMNSDSAGELLASRHSTDSKGHLVVLELPFVVGKERGVLKESVSTADCNPSVSIPWGKGTYQKH